MAEFEAKEQRVVVAVDESEESMYALSWCLRNLISPDTQTTLILLYAKPPPPLYSSLDGTHDFFSGDVIAAMEKYSRDLADSVMKRAESIYKDYTNIKVERKVGSGDAREVICMTVKKLGADMLVMGSHGYGFLKRTVLGSVSDYCAQHVKCPVLIVKRPKN
ncbi:PREDICTED: universal stress protein PHOS32-like [Nelumbo nucifera]|uniref:Universal stress protein PHOS32-like n=2 Tax=Nelumbo nucifera TaxID=4432 RepID=A0A1U8AY60_NELNU|nr:PREDICTED: universal stress protein PHOS32-like [Nelumbo nucifera]DAD33144.1 TPA_asm: hypothetical protein HUJ06_011995 [Nelumbo nucifera]